MRCESKEQLNLITSYLDDETRPDFVDDLPDKSEELFSLIEQCPAADSISMKSNTELELFFEFDAFEAMEELPKLLNAMACENAVYMKNSHDETLCYKLDDSYFSFLYSPQPLENESDDKKYNRNLNAEELEGANSAYEAGAGNLLNYLGRLS